MSILIRTCEIVRLAVSGITQDYGSSPSHSQLHHLEGMRDHLRACYDMKLNPTAKETELYELADTCIMVAIELHTDENFPCCQ